jgi:PAS domain S-box-containing protein
MSIDERCKVHRAASSGFALFVLMVAFSVPAGGEMMFQEPAAWEGYRWYILAAVLFLLMETALVGMLLVQIRRARRAKILLERRFSIERVVSECSTRLSRSSSSEVDDEIKKGLQALLEAENVDRASWFVIEDSGIGARSIFDVHRNGVSSEPLFHSRPELPWLSHNLLMGKPVALAGLDDLPAEAHIDRSYLEKASVKSLAFIPSSHAPEQGVLVLVSQAEERKWPAALMDRLGVLGNIFGSALIRKQAQEARQQSEEKFRYLFTAAPIGIALEDLEGNLLFVNPALCSMLGYTQEEMTNMNCSQFADPDDEKEDWQQFQALRSGVARSYQLEKRYTRKDGGRIWGRLNVSTLNSTGQAMLVLATLEDITEKRVALEDLKHTHVELRRLTGRLMSAQEEERRRISRELHDDIGQRLSLLMMNLGLLEHKMPAERLAERAEIRSLLGDLDELATDVHNMSHQLHSSKLEHIGLTAALREVCRQLSGQHHVVINLTADQMTRPLPQQVSLCFYRVAQEALTNAVKHSGSWQVNVTVTLDGKLLRMLIKDFGAGFDLAVKKNGLGLVTMQERLRMIGGVLRVNSVAGRGTELVAEANLDYPEQSAKVA